MAADHPLMSMVARVVIYCRWACFPAVKIRATFGRRTATCGVQNASNVPTPQVLLDDTK
jgi:hypothetical protein